MKSFQVWHAGGCSDVDGVGVEALTPEEAAQVGAAHLFEPEDPIDRFDVFAQAERGPAIRFAILCDVTRVRVDERTGSSRVESVEFTVARLDVAPQSIQA